MSVSNLFFAAMSRFVLFATVAMFCFLVVIDNTRAVPCGDVMCAKYCEYGFQTDENGCDICQCNSSAQKRAACSDVMCDMYCENGFQTDENGCDICQCNTSAQKRAALCKECRMMCPEGQDFPRDKDGCPTACECQ